MTEMRIEKDLLGELEVPADAYYGIHTQRALNNFQISSGKLQDHPELIRGLVMVKKACALANLESRIIHPNIAGAIIKACDLILEEGRCMDQFPEDVFQGGAGTSANMNVNEVIANLALEVMGLEKGLVDIDTRMQTPCTGGYWFGGRFVRCWDTRGHGSVTLAQAIARSCNVYFYTLVTDYGLTMDMIAEMGMRYGFGQKTGRMKQGRSFQTRRQLNTTTKSSGSAAGLVLASRLASPSARVKIRRLS